MPRAKRIIPENAALHVISRGNNRNTVFHSDNDKLRYYTLLRGLKNENKIDIFHYCLMNTHTHIILSLNPDSTLSRFMKQLNLMYFHYYRKKYGYLGHFWQDRFKSNIIDMDSYLLQCGKYIELNPVRAGMVKYPGEYLFSSYNRYANSKPDELITLSPAYLGLSDSAQIRKEQYVDFVVDSSIINLWKTRGRKQGKQGDGSLVFKRTVPFISVMFFQAWQKERRAMRKGGVDYRRINRILLSKELLFGRHLIIKAIKNE